MPSAQVGKLHLVDLAGSEKAMLCPPPTLRVGPKRDATSVCQVGKTGATGDRLDEAIHRMHDCMLHASAALIQAKNINRSLSALGNAQASSGFWLAKGSCKSPRCTIAVVGASNCPRCK